jgi:hypothetical protein
MSAPEAEAAAEAATPPVSLPPALVLHIVSLLPVDTRARCAAVSRALRDALSERSAWTRLDLSPSSGVTRFVTDTVLRGAASKAGGALTALDVSGCVHITFGALMAVVVANSETLRELCAGVRWSVYDDGDFATLNAARIERLLFAAPQLRSFVADVRCLEGVVDARRMLRNEPPFQTLRVRWLRAAVGAQTDEATMLALAADVAAHASLVALRLENAPLQWPGLLSAVADAALVRQLVALSFFECELSPPCAPALVRLVSGDALTELSFRGSNLVVLDAPGAALLANALRQNSTLTSMSLCCVGLWRDAAAAAALLAALTAHRSLRILRLDLNPVPAAHQAGAGAALGALVAANAPALQQLSVCECNLDDLTLRPLCEALPANTHLRELHMTYRTKTDAFARDVLLPAVRANTSLRILDTRLWKAFPANNSSEQAEALVAARAIAEAAAAK